MMTQSALRDHLDRLGDTGKTATFWLRDDDAVDPTQALDRLLLATGEQAIPLTLAVIPEKTGKPLAERLERERHALVAVHGWSHRNHAEPPAKKQELGLHRPAEAVLSQLSQGREKLQELHGPACLAMLVPPWNRIAPEIVARLPSAGFAALSVFGREEPAPLPLLNTHVDIMDWRGTRGGRDSDQIFSDILDLLESEQPVPAIGILTHHLVHDEQAWQVIDALFELTASHPACRWLSPQQILSV